MTDGNWTNEASSAVDLYASVGESAIEDADYIASGVAPVGDTCVLQLSPISTPLSGTVTLHVRVQVGGVATVDVSFVWAAVAGANNYRLMVGPSTGVYTTYDANVGNATTSPSLSLAAGTYYYQVLAYYNLTWIETLGEYSVTITGSE